MEKLLLFIDTRKKKKQKEVQTKVHQSVTITTFGKTIEADMAANNQSGFVGFLAAIIVAIWVISSFFRRREKKMTKGQTLPEATNFNCTDKNQSFSYYMTK